MGRTQANPSTSQPQEYHYEQQVTDDVPLPICEPYNDENHQDSNHQHDSSHPRQATTQPPPQPTAQMPPPPPQAYPQNNPQPVSYPPQAPPRNYPPQSANPQAYPPQATPVQFQPPPLQPAYQASMPVAVQFPPPSPSQGIYQGSEPGVVQFPPPPSQTAYQSPQEMQYQQRAQFHQAQTQMGGQMNYTAMPPASPLKPMVQQSGVAPGFPMQNQYPQIGTEGWKSDLFGCMDDPTNALVTAIFPCLTFGQIAEIVDNGHTSCGTSGMLYGLIAFFIGMPCIISCTYRTKLRSRYGLVESPAPDWVIHCCCECCALCQEYRELQHRGFDPSIGWMGNMTKMQSQQQIAMVPPMNQTMMG